jgi:hypothetical protein
VSYEPFPGLDVSVAPRELASHLLHIGAEVEHALAVQYLYAAYSLGASGLLPAQAALVQQWRSTVIEIAREEMGHFVTVLNLLTAIGSPISLDREDFPIPTDLYPFPFELEPLTKRSLGKYVLAEMPDRATLDRHGLGQEIDAIAARVELSDTAPVHRVGLIYERVKALLTPPSGTPDPATLVNANDFQIGCGHFQASEGEWQLGYKNLLILKATSRTAAQHVVHAIAEQGEGAGIPPPGSDPDAASHFERFLAIYRAFPDDDAWRPARHAAINPTTDASGPADRKITNPMARSFADLANLRYRMLLTCLGHAFRLKTPGPGESTPRGLLISWAFGEMYNLRSLAEILMEMPLQDDPDVRAGPPFEMPYSLALPTRDADCWRVHRDLVLAAQAQIRQIRNTGHPGSARYLAALEQTDLRALTQIATIVGG